MISLCKIEDLNECASLLHQTFPHSYTFKAAKDEIKSLINNELLLKYTEHHELIAYIGAINQYDGTTYELHPLLVKNEHRRKGVGKKLIKALEKELLKKQVFNLYLGTDDEFFQTSLSDGDLYIDTFQKIENIKNYHDHPYSFYQKQGFKIVGVIPDANGKNKPDIIMAKRLGD